MTTICMLYTVSKHHRDKINTPFKLLKLLEPQYPCEVGITCKSKH